MRRSSLILASLLLIGVAGVSQAQRTSIPSTPSSSTSLQTPTVFEVTPYVGVMVFGDYLSGAFGTAVTNAPATLYGAEIGMRIAPNLKIIGNVATASSDIQASLPYVGGVSLAQSTVQMFDLGLQYELGTMKSPGFELTPILQAGAGQMRYSITQSYFTTNSNNFAANVGAGADIAVGRGVGVKFMVKDYIGNFNMQQATGFNASTNTTNNFAFTAGLRFSF
jgi:hypothetical protein